MAAKMSNLLKEVLENPNSENVMRWKNELRSKFANDLGPRMVDLILTEEKQSSDRIVLIMVMAEAMGDMLAQVIQKTTPKDNSVLLVTTFMGMVEQLQTCGLDFLQRNEA